MGSRSLNGQARAGHHSIMSCRSRQTGKKKATVVTVITKKKITRLLQLATQWVASWRLVSTDDSTSGSSSDSSSCSECDCSNCVESSSDASSDASSSSSCSCSSCCPSSSGSSCSESESSDEEEVCHRGTAVKAARKTSSKPLVGKTSKAAPKTVKGNRKPSTTSKSATDGKKKSQAAKPKKSAASAKSNKPAAKSKVVSTPVKKTSTARRGPRKANGEPTAKQASSRASTAKKQNSPVKSGGKPSTKQADQKDVSSKGTKINLKQTSAQKGNVKSPAKPKGNTSKGGNVCEPKMSFKCEMVDDCPGRSA
ncbi:hypothetical protein EGW08_007129 [Elysia chlorotica]|uniref:Uncharacterized protein n=1 Tax=Elysia chlorotica TaxID=188477 RepID=A0A3S1A891_ELYCH|nr:hypothetical protein EGW08_007129 [Elysia chlorotica]